MWRRKRSERFIINKIKQNPARKSFHIFESFNQRSIRRWAAGYAVKINRTMTVWKPSIKGSSARMGFVICRNLQKAKKKLRWQASVVLLWLKTIDKSGGTPSNLHPQPQSPDVSAELIIIETVNMDIWVAMGRLQIQPPVELNGSSPHLSEPLFQCV